MRKKCNVSERPVKQTSLWCECEKYKVNAKYISYFHSHEPNLWIWHTFVTSVVLKHENTFAFSLSWIDYSSPASWKIRTCLSYIVHIMHVDDMATVSKQNMVLIYTIRVNYTLWVVLNKLNLESLSEWGTVFEYRIPSLVNPLDHLWHMGSYFFSVEPCLFKYDIFTLF